MEQIKNRALLITGTVVPNSNFVTHVNTEQRLKEYMDSLLFYSNEFPNDTIYFLENSEYDFNLNHSFQKVLTDNKITLIKFPVSSKYLEGKGYQEFEMLDKAIEKLGDKYNSFIKITGRYKVQNAFALTNVVCDELIIDCHKKTKVAITNFFYVNTIFYRKNLKNLYHLANDSKSIFIEHVIYNCILKNGLLNQITMFIKNPIIIGTSGSYGGTLNRNKIKMKLRNIERKLYSFIGIKQFLFEY